MSDKEKEQKSYQPPVREDDMPSIKHSYVPPTTINPTPPKPKPKKSKDE